MEGKKLLRSNRHRKSLQESPLLTDNSNSDPSVPTNKDWQKFLKQSPVPENILHDNTAILSSKSFDSKYKKYLNRSNYVMNHENFNINMQQEVSPVSSRLSTSLGEEGLVENRQESTCRQKLPTMEKRNDEMLEFLQNFFVNCNEKKVVNKERDPQVSSDSDSLEKQVQQRYSTKRFGSKKSNFESKQLEGFNVDIEAGNKLKTDFSLVLSSAHTKKVSELVNKRSKIEKSETSSIDSLKFQVPNAPNFKRKTVKRVVNQFNFSNIFESIANTDAVPMGASSENLSDSPALVRSQHRKLRRSHPYQLDSSHRSRLEAAIHLKRPKKSGNATEIVAISSHEERSNSSSSLGNVKLKNRIQVRRSAQPQVNLFDELLKENLSETTSHSQKKVGNAVAAKKDDFAMASKKTGETESILPANDLGADDNSSIAENVVENKTDSSHQKMTRSSRDNIPLLTESAQQQLKMSRSPGKREISHLAKSSTNKRLSKQESLTVSKFKPLLASTKVGSLTEMEDSSKSSNENIHSDGKLQIDPAKSAHDFGSDGKRSSKTEFAQRAFENIYNNYIRRSTTASPTKIETPEKQVRVTNVLQISQSEKGSAIDQPFDRDPLSTPGSMSVSKFKPQMASTKVHIPSSEVISSPEKNKSATKIQKHFNRSVEVLPSDKLISHNPPESDLLHHDLNTNKLDVGPENVEPHLNNVPNDSAEKKRGSFLFKSPWLFDDLQKERVQKSDESKVSDQKRLLDKRPEDMLKEMNYNKENPVQNYNSDVSNPSSELTFNADDVPHSTMIRTNSRRKSRCSDVLTPVQTDKIKRKLSKSFVEELPHSQEVSNHNSARHQIKEISANYKAITMKDTEVVPDKTMNKISIEVDAPISPLHSQKRTESLLSQALENLDNLADDFVQAHGQVEIMSRNIVPDIQNVKNTSVVKEDNRSSKHRSSSSKLSEKCATPDVASIPEKKMVGIETVASNTSVSDEPNMASVSKNMMEKNITIKNSASLSQSYKIPINDRASEISSTASKESRASTRDSDKPLTERFKSSQEQKLSEHLAVSEKPGKTKSTREKESLTRNNNLPLSGVSSLSTEIIAEQNFAMTNDQTNVSNYSEIPVINYETAMPAPQLQNVPISDRQSDINSIASGDSDMPLIERFRSIQEQKISEHLAVSKKPGKTKSTKEKELHTRNNSLDLSEVSNCSTEIFASSREQNFAMINDQNNVSNYSEIPVLTYETVIPTNPKWASFEKETKNKAPKENSAIESRRMEYSFCWEEDLEHETTSKKSSDNNPLQQLKKPVSLGTTNKGNKGRFANATKKTAIKVTNYRKHSLPRPQIWVTDRFYQRVMPKFEEKFGFEGQLRCEEFVVTICHEVKRTISSKKNWKISALAVRKLLYDANLIKSQSDFFDFVEKFLPREFNTKVSPLVTYQGQYDGLWDRSKPLLEDLKL